MRVIVWRRSSGHITPPTGGGGASGAGPAGVAAGVGGPGGVVTDTGRAVPGRGAVGRVGRRLTRGRSRGRGDRRGCGCGRRGRLVRTAHQRHQRRQPPQPREGSHAAWTVSTLRTGSSSVICVPFPGAERTRMRPPWRRTTCFTTASPIPVPSSLVVK